MQSQQMTDRPKSYQIFRQLSMQRHQADLNMNSTNEIIQRIEQIKYQVKESDFKAERMLDYKTYNLTDSQYRENKKQIELKKEQEALQRKLLQEQKELLLLQQQQNKENMPVIKRRQLYSINLNNKKFPNYLKKKRIANSPCVQQQNKSENCSSQYLTVQQPHTSYNRNRPNMLSSDGTNGKARPYTNDSQSVMNRSFNVQCRKTEYKDPIEKPQNMFWQNECLRNQIEKMKKFKLHQQQGRDSTLYQQQLNKQIQKQRNSMPSLQKVNKINKMSKINMKLPVIQTEL